MAEGGGREKTTNHIRFIERLTALGLRHTALGQQQKSIATADNNHASRDGVPPLRLGSLAQGSHHFAWVAWQNITSHMGRIDLASPGPVGHNSKAFQQATSLAPCCEQIPQILCVATILVAASKLNCLLKKHV